MDLGHPLPDQVVRSELARALEVPGPDHALCEERLRRDLQADGPWSSVVLTAASFLDPRLHRHLRTDRPYTHRRPAAGRLLYGGNRHLELFFLMPYQDLRHLYLKCRHIRKGLLPEAGGACVRSDNEPPDLWDPVRSVPSVHGLLFP